MFVSAPTDLEIFDNFESSHVRRTPFRKWRVAWWNHNSWGLNMMGRYVNFSTEFGQIKTVLDKSARSSWKLLDLPSFKVDKMGSQMQIHFALGVVVGKMLWGGNSPPTAPPPKKMRTQLKILVDPFCSYCYVPAAPNTFGNLLNS